MDSTVPASALDFSTLRGSLQGEVLVAGDPDYDPARAVWNAMIDRRPDAIVRCRGVGDVIDAVRFAGDQHLALQTAAQGGEVQSGCRCRRIHDLILVSGWLMSPRLEIGRLNQ